MMSRSPRCYIQGFAESSPMVLEKIFEGDFTIYGHGSHVGHLTSIMCTKFHYHVPESLPTKSG